MVLSVRFCAKLSLVIVFFASMGVMWSCKSEQHDGEGEIIHLSELTEIEGVDLNDERFIDSYSVIRLETAENSLIGKTDQIKIFNDLIYILDRKQTRILVFDQNGTYIRDIGRKGRGAGEFLAISSFYISPGEEKVSILDPLKSAVLSYSLAGDFIESKKIELTGLGPISRMEHVGNGQVLLYANPNIFDDRMLYILDEADLSVKNVITESPFKPDAGSYIMANQPYSVVSGEIHYLSMFSKEIWSYSIDNSTSNLLFVMEDDKPQLSPEALTAISDKNNNSYSRVAADILNNDEYSVGLQNLFEGDRFILCNFRFSSTILWDKIDRKGYVISGSGSSAPSFADIAFSEKNTFIKVWGGSQIANFKEDLQAGIINYANSDSKISDIIATYDPMSDNPVLLIFNMKR